MITFKRSVANSHDIDINDMKELQSSQIVFSSINTRASENIFRLQCKRRSSKWASPHHKQFATFLHNFYIFKQLLGNFEIWASVRRTRRTLFSDALINTKMLSYHWITNINISCLHDYIAFIPGKIVFVLKQASGYRAGASTRFTSTSTSNCNICEFIRVLDFYMSTSPEYGCPGLAFTKSPNRKGLGKVTRDLKNMMCQVPFYVAF